LASQLRRELAFRNRQYAARRELSYRESYGDSPVVCYLPSEDSEIHGNFLPETYRAILSNDNWRSRLNKVHTSARSSLPREDHTWRELDSCNSSDALLMNVFCHPGLNNCRGLLDLLGVEAGAQPEFGVRANVPLANGRFDRTEVDMRLGSLLVEAKLTETDFQSAPKSALESYRDFAEVFDARRLPGDRLRYQGYQLVRNVLAAAITGGSFCVMLDARRPDLLEMWFGVMSSVRDLDLRLRCKVVTWQELVDALPSRLQPFLEEKYGILPATSSMIADTYASSF
jgi:hypothetical protein